MSETNQEDLLDQFSGAFARLKPADINVIGRLQPLLKVDNLQSVFQPIFRATTGELEGCEALIRLPVESGFASPADAFTDSVRVGLLQTLEAAATTCHLRAVRGHAHGKRLFLNLSAPLFSDPRFGVSWLVAKTREAELAPHQVVLEIPETLRIRNTASFVKHIEPFRREGFQIAIDDFGAGYTNLRMISDLSPDFVKVDRVFVDGIASHARKRILVESVVTLCHRVNCSVIAEGIELPLDLEICLSAGVDFLQGFLFARPQEAETAFEAAELALPAPPTSNLHEEVKSLLNVETPLSPNEMGSAGERFAASPRLRAIPVVVRETIAGLLKRPPDVDPVPDAFDWLSENASLEEAVALVRQRPESRRFDPIVIVGPNRLYRGLLPIDRLLSQLARLNNELALQANPLTGLPSRLIFERALAHRLERETPVAVARLNLQRFKPFNDRYGFARGDDLLHALVSVIRDQLSGLPNSLIAHFAGDDFAYLGPIQGSQMTATSVIQRFLEAAKPLYDADDLAAEGFTVPDRLGAPRKVPLVGLSIGIVLWKGDDAGVRTVLEAAETTLRGARNRDESYVLVNRRDLKTASRPSAENGDPADDDAPAESGAAAS